MTRVTADPDSPDFWPLSFRTCPEITVDGESIDRVWAADDVLGFVEHYQKNPLGCVCLCECRERAIMSLTFGKVEIVGERR